MAPEQANSGHQRVFPGPAPNIQDTAPEGARFGQRQERGLGPADVPWRCAGGSPRPHGITVRGLSIFLSLNVRAGLQLSPEGLSAPAELS